MRFFIENIECGYTDWGEIIVGEAKVKTDAGESFYFSCAGEYSEFWDAFKSPESTFTVQTEGEEDEFFEQVDPYRIESPMENEADELYPIHRLLFAICTEHANGEGTLAKDAVGHWVDELADRIEAVFEDE